MSDSLPLKKISPYHAPLPEERVTKTTLHPSYYTHDSNGEERAEDGPTLRQCLRAVRNHKWLIIAVTVVATTLVTVMVFLTSSSYRATAIIEVGKEDTALIQVAEDLLIQNDDTPKTKSFILKSTPLLEEVVVNLHLYSNRNFLGISDQAPDEFHQLRSAEGGGGPNPDQNADKILSAAESRQMAPFVEALEKGLEVEEVPDTRLLKVSFVHTDPSLAADISNAVVESLIRRSFEKKTERFSQASGWLGRETLKLKQSMDEAEQALARFTRDRAIASPDGTSSVILDKLSRLHSEVMRAEADSILKRSIYDEVKEDRISQVPEAFTNARAVELQKRLGELMTTAAQLDANYGPESPEVIEIGQQIAAVRKQIDANTGLLEAKLKGDYNRAARDQQALKAMLGQAKAEAVQQNQTALRYSVLKAQFDTAKALYTDFLQKTNQASFQVAQQQNNLRVIQPARAPKFASSPNRPLIIGLSFTLSLAIGVGLALLSARFNNSITSIQDVYECLQLPTLGVIPGMSPRTTNLLSSRKESRSARNEARIVTSSVMEKVTQRPYNSISLAAEAYRVLRTTLLLSEPNKTPKTILFTSSKSGEGKTTTVANTAISLAQLGASVLVIDCDLRTPTINRLFGAPQDPGLATYLSGDVKVEPLICRLPKHKLSLLPAGTTTVNPAELLSSGKMESLLLALARRYDHILIDAPPLVNLAEPLILSTMVDGVIFVVHSGKSERDAVLRARDELLGVGADIFGVVLNDVDFRREGLGYYYEHYFGQK